MSKEVCQWFAAGLWFALGTPVCSTNKTDRHDIAAILLNVRSTPYPNPIDTNAEKWLRPIVSVWHWHGLEDVCIIETCSPLIMLILLNLRFIPVLWVFLSCKLLKLFRFLNRLSLRAADDGYSRNVSCALHSICTFFYF